MKIKKYNAETEQEAIEKVKEELGLEALVLNIKKIKPKGVKIFFKKPCVEVTAAYDESKEKSLIENKANFLEEASKTMENDLKKITLNPNSNSYITNNNIEESINKEKTIIEQDTKIKKLEKKLMYAEDLINDVLHKISIENQSRIKTVRKYENSIVQLFYEVLMENGVTEEIASNILEDVSIVGEEIKDYMDINLYVKIIYNKIISILDTDEIFEIKKKELDGDPTVLGFFGPTGVGKTSTIAKLTSDLVLNKNMKVALITADTYRIAAVEQLKTYADILSIQVGVAYNLQDLIENYEKLKLNHDIILIDTAGRSHKDSESIGELKKLFDILPNSYKFLVLSTTTKYEDLINITNSYSLLSNFNFIFTKLDETNSLGSIVNIAYLTRKKIAYTTFGQDIPNDIEKTKPEKIARNLLGLGE